MYIHTYYTRNTVGLIFSAARGKSIIHNIDFDILSLCSTESTANPTIECLACTKYSWNYDLYIIYG